MTDSSPAVPAPEPLRRPWTAPTVTPLPPLSELTLQTGAFIPGQFGPGGSTVF
jgi:hypothetical protein